MQVCAWFRGVAVDYRMWGAVRAGLGQVLLVVGTLVLAELVSGGLHWGMHRGIAPGRSIGLLGCRDYWQRYPG